MKSNNIETTEIDVVKRPKYISDITVTRKSRLLYERSLNEPPVELNTITIEGGNLKVILKEGIYSHDDLDNIINMTMKLYNALKIK